MSDPLDVPPTQDEAEQARTRAAFERLSAVLSEVAAAVTSRVHERCPYRARDDRCTFAGGCVNQRRKASPGADAERLVWCGGDHQLRRRGA